MSFLQIVRRSLARYFFSTLVTAFSVAISAALLMSVWALKDISLQTFTDVTGGFDAVMGARSSELQLVLNSIFHLESSPGNIPWSAYQSIKANPLVRLAVPIATGDNYKGFRVVGTLPEMFTVNEYAKGKKFAFAGNGRVFDLNYQEAVIGSFVAQKSGLKEGDEFHPYHGINFNEKEQHEESYLVVGILKPSNTPVDRVIWIPVEGLQKMSGHAQEASAEISAVLLKFASPVAGQTLQQQFRRDTRFTLAWPIGRIVAQLFSKINWFEKILEMISLLVGVVATASILASVYNTMNGRKQEFALFRALGAGRRTILSLVVCETLAISLAGCVAGFLLYAGVMLTVQRVVQTETGIVLTGWSHHQALLWTPLGLMAAAGFAGLIPAWKAYGTDVATCLSHNP